MRAPWVIRLWETCLSVLGLSLFVHALWSTLFPKTNLTPAYITAAFSLTIDVLVRRPSWRLGHVAALCL